VGSIGGWRSRFKVCFLFLTFSITLVAFQTPVGYAQDAGEETKGFETEVSDLTLQGSTLPELVDLLATLGGISINVAGSVEPKLTVNLNVKTPKTLRQVLDDLANQYNLYIDYQTQPGGALIRPASEKPTKTETILEHTFPLRFNRPSELIDLVRNFLSDRPQADALPLDAEKAIVVRDIPEAIARIEEFLNRVDIPKQSTVFPILYGKAEEIANLIKERLPDLEEGAITVDTANSQLIVKTTLENLAEIQLLIETLDIKKEIRVFTISFHDVEDVVGVLEDLELLSEEATIAANENTGRLIIQDTPDHLDRIAEAIAAYDTPRPAVFVEAEILDVNADYNFNWNPSLTFSDGIPGETKFSAGSDLFSGQRILNIAGTGSFEFAALDAGNVLARLKATESDTDAQTIASPRILVERGEESRLNVGSEEPIGVRSFSNSTLVGTSRDIVTQRVREVGVRLIIFARNISDKGYVELEVGLENSRPGARIDIGGGTTGLQVFTTNVETVAVLKDGRTLAVGGLLQRNQSTSSGGTPFLNRVPLIRYFFSNLARSDNRRKLLLFITPHILNVDTPLKKYREENAGGPVTLGEEKHGKTVQGETLSPTSKEWSKEGETQWINRNGKWGYLDQDGRFVDRTDLFLGAYQKEGEKEQPVVARPIPANGPSASELLKGLEEAPPESPQETEAAHSKAKEVLKKAPAPEKLPVELAPPKPEEEKPAPPDVPEKAEEAPAPTTPPAPSPSAEPPQAEAPSPSPRAPRLPSKPAVTGEAAVKALKTSADSVGKFKGTLRDLIQRVRSDTGVQFSINSQINRSLFDAPIEVDGTGKTYDQLMQQALDPHGMVYRGRKTEPPQILNKTSGAPAPIKAAPAPPPQPAPAPPSQPQSRANTSQDDPWAEPPVAGGWASQGKRHAGQGLASEEWTALSSTLKKKPVNTGPAPSPQTEDWEEPLQTEEPVAPSSGRRLSPPSGFELRSSAQSVSNEEWDRMLNATAPGLGSADSSAPSPVSRHTALSSRASQVPVNPGPSAAPASYVRPTGAELSSTTHAKKKGAWSKLKGLFASHK
jgi:type II secretory pathway component GspD/PulD (secretin)